MVSHKVSIVIISLRSSLVSDVEVSCPLRVFSNHHTLLLRTVSKVLILSRGWRLSSCCCGCVSVGSVGPAPAYISLPLGDCLFDGELLLDVATRGHFATVWTSEIK